MPDDQMRTEKTDADHMGAEQLGVVQAPPGAPRWVKVVALIAVLVIAIVVLKAVVGGGGHGPGRHGALTTTVADVD